MSATQHRDEPRGVRHIQSLRGAPDINGSLKAILAGRCPRAAPFAGEMPLKDDVHPRAGSPPGQDDAVEQAKASCILSAPDERRERTGPVHDLVHGLESSDVPVQARLSPEDLCVERARETVTGEAFEKRSEEHTSEL